MTTRRRQNPAVRAEPRSIGTSGARDPLAREIRLLGALLGQVLVEQEGLPLLELVERIRRRAIARRRGGAPADRTDSADPDDLAALAAELADLPPVTTAAVVRAFGLYFALVNLAEERHRVRTLRRAERAARGRPADDPIAEALARLARSGGGGPVERIRHLAIEPVLTAHPTEARRRTILVALRRCARLLGRLDDPRLSPLEDREIRRRLREEITILWRTADLRAVDPSPLDEVRTAMVFFDETLFTTVPALYRAIDAALDRDSGARPPLVPAFLRIGSWIGGDRDGHPAVTADVTARTLRIQADHVLRGYEAVCHRLMASVSAAVPDGQVAGPIAARLARDADELPETMRMLTRRFPHEPYRQRLGAMAERLHRTRLALTETRGPTGGRYPDATAFRAELADLSAALGADGLPRIAYGEIAELRWQAETFGFHLASLEVRQHAAVHAEALALLRSSEAGAALEPGRELRSAPGVTLGEVMATLRAMAAIQARFGEDACRRYVVSFTRRPSDATNVLALAEVAGRAEIAPADTGGFVPWWPAIDVVPLLESEDVLAQPGGFLDALLADPGYRAHLQRRGDRQEIMLGYSDTNKELGFLAAAWLLYRAQGELVRVARSHGIVLTLFHGRGGAIGRGGGPARRAILGQAPGSIDGRLKITEQGEVVAARYADPAIARRELEEITGAVLIVSSPDHESLVAAAERIGRPVMDELAERARVAYRSLVWEDPAFETFFRAATPIDELAELRFGSRPASRRPGCGTLEDVRAIPWVFAWTQSRIGLPGWFGLGTALAGFVDAHGSSGHRQLRRLYRQWPFFESLIDNAELVLARTDLGIGRLYAELAAGEAADRIFERIADEHQLTVEGILDVTGRAHLLDGLPTFARSIARREPYVDPLSLVQVGLLRRLRARPADDPERAADARLVGLTVSGVAAALQGTG
jgi:phosphoenolpyruvate carboxylase